MGDWKEDYNWKCAFEYAGGEGYGYGGANVSTVPGSSTLTHDFSISNVVHVEAMIDGEHDGDSWVMVGRLADGRWFSLVAGCDYTGSD